MLPPSQQRRYGAFYRATPATGLSYPARNFPGWPLHASPIFSNPLSYSAERRRARDQRAGFPVPNLLRRSSPEVRHDGGEGTVRQHGERGRRVTGDRRWRRIGVQGGALGPCLRAAAPGTRAARALGGRRPRAEIAPTPCASYRSVCACRAVAQRYSMAAGPLSSHLH